MCILRAVCSSQFRSYQFQLNISVFCEMKTLKLTQKSLTVLIPDLQDCLHMCFHSPFSSRHDPQFLSANCTECLLCLFNPRLQLSLKQHSHLAFFFSDVWVMLALTGIVIILILLPECLENLFTIFTMFKIKLTNTDCKCSQ